MFYSQSLEVLNPAKAIREALEDDMLEPTKHKELGSDNRLREMRKESGE